MPEETSTGGGPGPTVWGSETWLLGAERDWEACYRHTFGSMDSSMLWCGRMTRGGEDEVVKKRRDQEWAAWREEAFELKRQKRRGRFVCGGVIRVGRRNVPSVNDCQGSSYERPPMSSAPASHFG